jgi:hypothetical protein
MSKTPAATPPATGSVDTPQDALKPAQDLSETPPTGTGADAGFDDEDIADVTTSIVYDLALIKTVSSPTSVVPAKKPGHFKEVAAFNAMLTDSAAPTKPLVMHAGDTVTAGQNLARLTLPEGGLQVVQAPVAGLISSSSATIGAMASGKGEPLFTIVARSEYDIVGMVPVKDIGRLQVGQQARVKVTGRSMPGTSGNVCNSWRCETCGCASASGTVSTRPAGIPMRLNVASHSEAGRARSADSSSEVRAARLRPSVNVITGDASGSTGCPTQCHGVL